MAKELARALEATGVHTITNPKFVLGFYLISAGGGALGATAPEIYAGLQTLGDAALGEYLANLEEITEFSEAFLDDLPAVNSYATAAGAALNWVRATACRAQDDKPWYCF